MRIDYKRNLKRYFWIFVYFIFTVLITRSLLRPGYVLSLDNAFTPNWSRQIADIFWGYFPPVYGGYVLQYLPQVIFEQIFPPDIIYKAYIFLIIWTCGLTAHRLLRTKSEIPRFFTGFLYACNPFVFTKISTGSWGLLTGYAFLPLFVRSSIDCFDKPSFRRIIGLLLTAVLIGINAHIAVLAIIIFSVLFLTRLLFNGNRKRIFLLYTYAFGIIGFVFINLYWILPIATNTSALPSLSSLDILYFAPKVRQFNIFITIASMYGYWNPDPGLLANPSGWWWVLFLPIFFLVLVGFFRFRKIWWVQSFLILCIIGFVLAIGIFGPLNTLLLSWPFFGAFRETYKFVILLVIPYTILGGLGLEFMRGVVSNFSSTKYLSPLPSIIIVVLSLTPFFYSYQMLDLGNRIIVSQFPDDWYKVNDILLKDNEDVSALLLPWHQFMSYGWTDVSKPQKISSLGTFFKKRTISAENLEVPGIYSQTTNPGQIYLDGLFAGGDFQNPSMGDKLAQLSIRYIILVKEADYDRYLPLTTNPAFKILYDGQRITLLQNIRPVSRLYRIDRNSQGVEEWSPVKYEKTGELSYHIAESYQDDVNFVFVPPNLEAKYWSVAGLNDNNDDSSYLVSFKNRGNVDISYGRFNILLIGYVMSSMFMLGVAAAFIFRRRG